MSGSQGRWWVGTSGFQYQHWAGVVYPPDLPRTAWFDYYSRFFTSVEINNTFYGLPAAEVFRRWHDQAPPGFLYALKFSRFGSHLKRLRDPEQTLGRFRERAVCLGEHLGPVLVQLPPHWRPDLPRLEAFLAALPAGWRWAMEFRDPAWLCRPVFERLRRAGVALCQHDLIPRHPREITADWVYLRFHGGADYSGRYGPRRLRPRVRLLRRWLAEGLDVHAYFNNDAAGHAFQDALCLRDLLAG